MTVWVWLVDSRKFENQNPSVLRNMFFGGDPFEHFAHAHGGGGGGGGRRGASSGKADDSLYKALGVEKGCDDAELKKAYKKLALKHHPDRGGDAEKVNILSKFSAKLPQLLPKVQRSKHSL